MCPRQTEKPERTHCIFAFRRRGRSLLFPNSENFPDPHGVVPHGADISLGQASGRGIRLVEPSPGES